MNIHKLLHLKSGETEPAQSVHKLIRSVLSESQKEVILVPGMKLVEDLGFDSIKFITVLLGLESIINKDIESIVAEIDLSTLQTVDDLVKFVASCKNK
jgi:acyl carrier protein